MASAQASAVALALQRTPIPLKPNIDTDDYEMVTLTNMVNDHKRKAEVPAINKNDAGLICKAVLEFEDATRASRLNLTTAALMYDKFCEITKGTYRTKFDQLRAQNAANLAGFAQAKLQFIAHYIKDTSLADQQAYLEGKKKPYSIPVPKLGERLEDINRLMAKFPGHEFQFLLSDAGIASKSVSSLNPQSNGIIESVHRSIEVALQTLFQASNPTTIVEANDLVDHPLATAMHATRCASHSSLNGASPGGLVFHRDMFLDIPFLADLLTIQGLHQQKIDHRLLQANMRCIAHEFRVGEQVLKRRGLKAGDKLKSSSTGHYPIEQIHTNGTVTIRLNQHIRERLNIRRLLPYRS